MNSFIVVQEVVKSPRAFPSTVHIWQKEKICLYTPSSDHIFHANKKAST